MGNSKFIVIDGTDGAGKSTMATELVSFLQGKGLEVQHTREPGGTPFCERIREEMLGFNKDNLWSEKIDSETELLMMFAMRNQHLKSRIIPALERGEWVVCERWTSSTFAYQGVARNIGTDKVLKMDRDFVSVKPDATLLFDVSPEVSRDRMGSRTNLDYIEKEEMDFFERVREGYHLYSKICVEPCHVIDASKSIDQVKNEMIKKAVKGTFLDNQLQRSESLCP